VRRRGPGPTDVIRRQLGHLPAGPLTGGISVRLSARAGDAVARGGTDGRHFRSGSRLAGRVAYETWTPSALYGRFRTKFRGAQGA
jgi:hypothetical protein